MCLKVYANVKVAPKRSPTVEKIRIFVINTFWAFILRVKMANSKSIAKKKSLTIKIGVKANKKNGGSIKKISKTGMNRKKGALIQTIIESKSCDITVDGTTRYVVRFIGAHSHQKNSNLIAFCIGLVFLHDKTTKYQEKRSIDKKNIQK